MSLSDRRVGQAAFGFPRVSGDEPEYQELGTLLGAFSPRERG